MTVTNIPELEGVMRRPSIAAIPMLLIAFAAWTPALLPAASGESLGAWWKDSEVVRELVLSQSQIKQIEQAFLDHRQPLSTLLNELNRQEAVLESLVDIDHPDEKSVAAQVDQVVAARGRLEKENTMLVFEIRRAISTDQWNKLQELQRQASSQAAAPPAAAVSSAPQKNQSRTSTPEEPVYAIGGPVTAPSPHHTVLPPAHLMPKSDDVLVFQVIIGQQGNAKNVRILHGVGDGMSDWLMKTIPREWDFRPGTLNGRAVSVLTTVGLNFRGGKVDIWWDR